MESSREILGKKSISDNSFCQMLNTGRLRIESELRNEPELIQKSSIHLSPRISQQKRNYSLLPKKKNSNRKRVIGKKLRQFLSRTVMSLRFSPSCKLAS